MIEHNMAEATIVGGRGAMASFFKPRLQSCGLRVHNLDKPLSRQESRERVPGSDLLLLAVPPEAVQQVLEDLSGFLSRHTILVDICSVKVRPLQRMLQMHQGPVVGSHPLFGPDPDPQNPLRVALIRGRDEQGFRRVLDLLQKAGTHPFESEAEEHDKAMAYIQGLNFLSSMAYLAASAHAPSIEKYVTPSFERRLEAARKMLNEDARMFADLFEANPHSLEALRSYRNHLDLAADGEVDLLLNKACWWWKEKDNSRGGV